MFFILYVVGVICMEMFSLNFLKNLKNLKSCKVYLLEN